MTDEVNELQDTLNPDEVVSDQEPELETADSEAEGADIEALQAKAEKADEYKKFADRTAAENKELKKQLKTEPKIKESSSDQEDRFARLELKTDGYKGGEIDFIMRNGGPSAVNDPLVKAAIESLRKAEKSKDATPSGTNKSPVYQKFTERDLKKMSLEELEKIVPQE